MRFCSISNQSVTPRGRPTKSAIVERRYPSFAMVILTVDGLCRRRDGRLPAAGGAGRRRGRGREWRVGGRGAPSFAMVILTVDGLCRRRDGRLPAASVAGTHPARGRG